MSSKPDGDWKYILCYRDHGTKICFLRPLATKTVRSVAWALLDIFSVIAPPVRLQTDNGLEFSNIANAAADSGGGDAADGISEEMVPFFFLPLAPCPHCGIIDFEIEINDFNLKIIDFNLEINDYTVRARGKGQEKKGTISSLTPSASAPASPAPLSAAAFAIFWNSRPLSVCNRTGGAITEKMSSNAHATERTVLVARGRKKHILVPWSL